MDIAYLHNLYQDNKPICKLWRKSLKGDDDKIKLKILLLGTGDVGKTSLIDRLAQNEWNMYHHDYYLFDYEQQIFVDGESIYIDIFVERLRKQSNFMISHYMSNFNFILLCFAINDNKSYQLILNLIKNIDREMNN